MKKRDKGRREGQEGRKEGRKEMKGGRKEGKQTKGVNEGKR